MGVFFMWFRFLTRRFHSRRTMRLCYLPIVMMLMPILFMAPVPAQAVSDGWDGVWFTCEFAQRTNPPDDGCQMFDDEGFQVESGQFSYLRMKGSQETACRGNKKGQCFRADLSDITVTKRSVGKIDIGPGWIKVRYFGCTQLYHIEKFADFYEAVPDDKKCFWANKRQFYVARYHGNVRYKGQ